VPPFLPGLQLCRAFYEDAVRPLVDEAYPGLPYAAARVGPGSEVVGYDTARSTDHDWGPRLELFLAAEDVDRYARPLADLLAARLPTRVRGWPTHFTPGGNGVRLMTPTATGPVAHRVSVTDVATWCGAALGFDASAGVTVADWLAVPTQLLAEATGGAVYHDGTGELTAVRDRLRWYPDDVWRYVLAAQWTRIAQEEPFVGRTAEAGDELGSAVLTARLVRDVMRLCLLLARTYPPYSKWLGTAFAALPGATSIGTALRTALADPDQREDALCTAYESAGRWQNALGLAEPVDPVRRPFHDRPYLVVDAARFATALRTRITDPELAARPLVGAVDQYVDSTDVLARPELTRAIHQATRT
jgi:hypothetical protein